MCVFQERVLLINGPRNFVLPTVQICLSSYVICMSEVHVLLLVSLMKQVVRIQGKQICIEPLI